jgi:capsular polysaccharide biosynthesis protein
MDMFYYFNILKKRFLLITFGMILFMGITYYYNFYMIEYTYESNSTIYVGAIKSNEDLSIISDLNAANVMIIDYREMVSSRKVLDSVIEDLKDEYDRDDLNYNELSNKVFVNLMPDTRILKISVQDNDPKFCKSMSDGILNNFITKAKSLTDIDNINILDEPVIPEIPIKPSKKKNFAFSFVFSLSILVGLTILIELLDKKIRNKEHLERANKLKVIGTIPKISFDNKKTILKLKNK